MTPVSNAVSLFTIYQQLQNLYWNNQFGLTTVRSVLDQVNEGNTNDFFTEFYNDQDYRETIAKRVIQLGLVPVLPEGYFNPIEVSDGGYVHNDQATAYINVQYGEPVPDGASTLQILMGAYPLIGGYTYPDFTQPTPAPTEAPTAAPTEAPTEAPTPAPTEAPTGP